MADYRPISDTEVDPDAPVTSELAYAFRDNPIAIAEGAAGAPRVAGRSLNMFLGGIYIDGSGAGFSSLDLCTWIYGSISFTPGSAPGSIELRYSNNNGSTWGAWQNVMTREAGSGATIGFGVWFNIFTGQYLVSDLSQTSGTHSVPNNSNAFQIRRTSGQASGIFEIHGGRS